jgi:molybdopterin synthase sulfur carrier subunit
MTRIRLLLFGRYQDDLGLDQLELELPDEVTDLAALRSWLANRDEQWQALCGPANPQLMAAVNQQMADAATPIQAGDEVALFPPVTGG